MHIALADIASEQELFEDALSDYKEGYDLLHPKLQVHNRASNLLLQRLLKGSFPTPLTGLTVKHFKKRMALPSLPSMKGMLASAP